MRRFGGVFRYKLAHSPDSRGIPGQLPIFNIGGEFFGLFNRCPHQGGSLCDGRLTGLLRSPQPGQFRYTRQGEILRCPWHGWEFDIRTGQSYCGPEKIRTRAYPVEVEPGRSVVEGPYVAETVPGKPPVTNALFR